jgi:stage II sporulation protein D
MGMTSNHALLWTMALLAWSLVAVPARADAPLTIRVVLSDSGTKQQLGGSLEWFIGDRLVARTTEATTIAKDGDGIGLESKGTLHKAQRLRAVPTDGQFRFGGRQYRGHAELFAGKQGGVVVLNILPLEDYLLGVVAAEMPAGWPPEALKAQAVAARTFALARMAARQELTYDVYATVNDQVYLGINGEDERTSRAVRETAGQVLTYNGEPITAFFCSDAGGATKLGTEPYLQPVACANPASPFKEWSLSLTPAQVDSLITAAGGQTGKITTITAENDQISGHLVAITFTGSKGKCRITGPKLRNLLGLESMRSTYAHIELPGAEVCPLPTDVQPSLQMDETGADATEIALGPPTATSAMSSFSIKEFERPWVCGSSGSSALKLRGLWCYNGSSVVRCNHEVFAAGLEGMPGVPTPLPSPPSTALPQPPPAQQSYSEPGGFNGLVIRGSGYGHSLGMSQWGARGFAEQGWDYRAILTYFYTGVELVVWSGTPAPAAVLTEDEAGFYSPFTPGS